MRHSDKPILEELRVLKELHELERQRWVEWVRFGLILLAVTIFCISFWRTLAFLEHATDAQLLRVGVFRIIAHLLGLGGPACLLILIYKHYFPGGGKRK